MSLIGECMLDNREVTSEQTSLVCKGVGYDKIYLSWHKPVEDFTWSLEKESFVHSPAKEEEEEYKWDEKE